MAEKDIKAYFIILPDFFKSLAHGPMFIFMAVQLSSDIMCGGMYIYMCVRVCACVCYATYL